jgi:chemotaxis response regulator CheB
MSPIRVMVVDDHPVVRQGLVAVLEDEADLEVVGTADSGREALRLVQRLSPDVMLLDLEMPVHAAICSKAPAPRRSRAASARSTAAARISNRAWPAS